MSSLWQFEKPQKRWQKRVSRQKWRRYGRVEREFVFEEKTAGFFHDYRYMLEGIARAYGRGQGYRRAWRIAKEVVCQYPEETENAKQS